MALKRRIEILERTWPRRRSLAELTEEAASVAAIIGMTFEAAFRLLMDRITDDERPQIIAELEAFLGPDQMEAIKAELWASEPDFRPFLLPAEPEAV